MLKKVNLNELLEEVVDERVHAWVDDEGVYYLSVIEDNGDEHELTREKSTIDVYNYLSNHGLC